MQERNVLSACATTIVAPFVDGWEEMIVWLIVAVVLLLADLRFGIEAARKRGETIRNSRAVRRTINKFVDYLCWISISWVLGGSFGRIFGLPLLPAVTMLGVCIIELSSIIDNYCEARGIKKRFNGIKFFSAITKHPELEDCFEDKKEDENQG